MSELPTDAIREAIDKTYRVGYVYEYTQDKANIQLRALLDALKEKDARIAELEAQQGDKQ